MFFSILNHFAPYIVIENVISNSQFVITVIYKITKDLQVSQL